MNFVNHIYQAFERANKNESKIHEDILKLEGMSGSKTRHLYNNLVNFEGARYLEIGCWKGSTLASAMYKNSAEIVCIDNFSEFDDGTVKNILLNTIERYKGDNKVTFLDEDSFKVDVKKLPKFNIYMYDGDHKYDSHYRALLHYYDCLDDVFIFIVDDWNWSDVREGTRRSIEKLNLKVLYEKEMRLTWDNSVTPQPQLSQNWWNGIYVAVLKKA
jgi:hypothetical protein